MKVIHHSHDIICICRFSLSRREFCETEKKCFIISVNEFHAIHIEIDSRSCPENQPQSPHTANCRLETSNFPSTLQCIASLCRVSHSHSWPWKHFQLVVCSGNREKKRKTLLTSVRRLLTFSNCSFAALECSFLFFVCANVNLNESHIERASLASSCCWP